MKDQDRLDEIRAKMDHKPEAPDDRNNYEIATDTILSVYDKLNKKLYYAAWAELRLTIERLKL